MLNLLGRRSAAALRARAQPVVRRLLSSTSDAGFKSGLPGPGVAVPFVALGLYAVGWKATEDGQLEVRPSPRRPRPCAAPLVGPSRAHRPSALPGRRMWRPAAACSRTSHRTAVHACSLAPLPPPLPPSVSASFPSFRARRVPLPSVPVRRSSSVRHPSSVSQHLTREFEASMKTMTPEQLAATIPSPTVLWNLVWPIGTGLLTSVFESLAARLALAPDMRYAAATGAVWWASRARRAEGRVRALGMWRGQRGREERTPAALAPRSAPALSTHLRPSSVIRHPSSVHPSSFLCTEALDADYMAPTAIALLSFPVDHAPFVESLWAQGAVDKVAHILAIYKTLPPDQHDDVLTNAALIGARRRVVAVTRRR